MIYLVGYTIIVAVVIWWVRRKVNDPVHGFLENYLLLVISPIAFLFWLSGFYYSFFLDSFKQGRKSHES